MLRSSLVTAAVAVAIALGIATAPGSLGAQGSTALAPIVAVHPAPIAALTHAPAPGPTTDTTAVRLAGPWTATPAFAATPRATSDVATYRDVGAGKNLALMGVGAAAVVIGLLVGDDVGTGIAIGGGLLGLYGFYQFLR